MAGDAAGPQHSAPVAERPARSLPGIAAMREPMPRLFSGLSGRLVWFTIVFVMIAEVLIFVPSVAGMRMNWLRDRQGAAAAAAIVIDGLQPPEIPRSLQDEMLLATGTKVIALKKDGTSRLVAATDTQPVIDRVFDLASQGIFASIRDAVDTLVAGGGRVMRVYGPVGDSDMIVELVMTDDALRADMLKYAKAMFLASLLISVVSALLIFIAINYMMVKPIRRLTQSMQRFSEQPDDPGRLFSPDRSRGELAVAGRHLTAMQAELQRTLKQRKNLADLGMAVSKINHDMRNILASAQLVSDRLSEVDDPVVRRFAPTLLRSIDRAVGYTSDVLTYGQAAEAAPRRRPVSFAALLQDVRDMLVLDAATGIEFHAEVPADLEVDCDSEQLFRVIHNLCRNAVQALAHASPREAGSPRRLTVAAERIGSVVAITVDDNGPGMPQAAREHLFSAFKGSARSGGTGLGLVIARELVTAHGGTIGLVEKPGPGTRFRIEIPDRPILLDAYRAVAVPRPEAVRPAGSPAPQEK